MVIVMVIVIVIINSSNSNSNSDSNSITCHDRSNKKLVRAGTNACARTSRNNRKDVSSPHDVHCLLENM